MFPKINPRQMKKLMKQMGMEMEELEAKEVVIKLADSEIIIENPKVSVVTAMNQKTYQITGTEKVAQGILADDIKLVAAQANVGEEEARKALEEARGDLAQAILKLGARP